MWGRPDPRSREEQIQEARAEVQDGCDHGYLHLVPNGNEGARTLQALQVRWLWVYSTNASLVRSPFAGHACRTDELLEYRREEEQRRQRLV